MTTSDQDIRILIEQTARRLLAGVKTDSGNTCLVLWPDRLSDPKSAARLLEQMACDHRLIVAARSTHGNTLYSRFQPQQIDITGEPGQQELLQVLGQVSRVVWVQPPLHLLSDLVACNDRNVDVFLLLQALMQNLEVMIEPGAAARIITQSKAGTGKLDQYVTGLYDSIKELGINVAGLDASDQGELFAGSTGIESNTMTPMTAVKGKELLTEQDIIRQSKQGVRTITINPVGRL